MRLLTVLKRESPLVVAREAVWRAHRKWNKRRLDEQLEHPGAIKFRNIPYYRVLPLAIGKRAVSLILEFAEEIRAGRYPFLSYGTFELGSRPKWNVDFVSGVDWPQTKCDGHATFLRDGSDVKVPWEFSRLQFLPVLGKAHVLTGDDSYRQVAKDLLEHWIQCNPVPIGVNWMLAMEAALRAMSICLLLNLLSPFRNDEHYWLATVTRSLAQHLLYIEANLEFSHFITSNHYLSDLVGLYCLAMFLDGKGMEARRRQYRRKIEAEMMQQVYPDGGDYEGSTGYQVLVTQLFTSALLLMRNDSDAPSSGYVERLRMMFRFLHAVASSAGELPHVGDCDDGRTELLTEDLQQMLACPTSERNSLRVPHLLGIGQCLLNEGEGPGDDAAWYGLSERARTPYFIDKVNHDRVDSATVLDNSGIGILRHGSAELLFFAIPNGIFGKGSHTHNDKLSVVLRIGGQEILCDSGTGCYTRNAAIRNRFRSTAAHNTVRIDSTEQNQIPAGRSALFVLGNQAAVSPIETGRTAQGLFLRAFHKGYKALGVTHVRRIAFIEDARVFLVEDELDGDGVHEFELHFQVALGRAAEITEIMNGVTCCISGDPQVQITTTASTDLKSAVQPSLVSATFGGLRPAQRVRIWGKARFPVHINSRISWSELKVKETAGATAVRRASVPGDSVEGVCQE